jgi:hypothetical protein
MVGSTPTRFRQLFRISIVSFNFWSSRLTVSNWNDPNSLTQHTSRARAMLVTRFLFGRIVSQPFEFRNFN